MIAELIALTGDIIDGSLNVNFTPNGLEAVLNLVHVAKLLKNMENVI